MCDAVENAWTGVSNTAQGVVKGAVGVTKEAVSQVYDAVGVAAEQVGGVVKDTLAAIADDPLKAIAKVAAIATGQWELIPLIDGAAAVAHGKDIGEVVKTMAVSYVAQEAAIGVGEVAGQAAGEAFGKTAGQIIGAGSGAAAAAVVTGQDPLKAFLTGGISAAVPAVLGKIDGFTTLQKDYPNVAKTLQNVVATKLANGDVNAALINGLVTASGIVGKSLAAYEDATGTKLTAEQAAVASSALFATTTAALQGKNAGKALTDSLVASGTKALNKMVTSEFKSAVNSVAAENTAATAAGKALQNNQLAQESAVQAYNGVLPQQQIYTDEMQRRVGIDTAARAELTRLQAAGASVADQNKQIAVINETTSLVNDYAKFAQSNIDTYLKPQFDAAKADLATLQGQQGALEQTYTDAVGRLSKTAAPIQTTIDTAASVANKELTTTLDPAFNAKEYAELNGLPAGTDPYTHWVTTGKDAKAPTNLKAAEADIGAERSRIVLAALEIKGLNIATANPDEVAKIIDDVDRRYGNNLNAMKGASIQDIVAGNTTTLAQIAKDNAEGFRVDVAAGYGDWDKPPTTEFTLPEGRKFATHEAMADGTAERVMTDTGKSVWVTADATTAPKIWNPETNAYDATEITVRATAPSRAEIFAVAAQTNPESANILKPIAAAIASGVGQQVETWANSYSLAFGTDMKNTAANLGKTMQDWGQANTPASVIAQMDATAKRMKEIAKTGSMFDQAKATAQLVKENPAAYFAYLGREGAQEVLPIGGALVAGALATVLGAPVAAGAALATIVATTIDGIEVFGSSGKAIYDGKIKAGASEADARAAAVTGGVLAAAVTAPADALANATILVPYLRGVGAAANAALQGAKAVTANAAGEYIETFTQTLIQQKFINPSAPVDIGEANVQATFSAMVGAGTAGAIMAPTAVIGRTKTGEDLTLEGLRSGSQVADMSTVSPNTVIGTSSDGKTQITLGDTTISDAALGVKTQLADNVPAQYAPAAIDTFIDPLVTEEAEVRQTLEALGYTNPTQEEVNAYIGKTNEAASIAAVTEKYNPLATTPAEAQQMMRDLGYNNMTDAEAQSLAGKITTAEAQKAVEAYVNPRQVTEAEARQTLTDLGYTNPTAAEVSQFIRSGADVTEAAVKAEAATYADPRVTDKEEVEAAYAALGLAKPTAADVAKLVGVYSESELGGKAAAGLDSARYNSIISQLDTLAAGDKETVDAINLVKADLNKQLTTLGFDISGVKTDVAGVKTDVAALETKLTDAIAVNEAAGMDRDAATQKAIADVAGNLGTTRADLLAQLGTTEAALNTKLGNVETALTGQITDATATMNARVDELVAQGKTQAEATQQAFNEVNKLIGTQATPVTQQDLDVLQGQLQGNQQLDTKFDVNKDGVVNQADYNFLTNVVGGINTQPFQWEPTGLYGQIATSEAARKEDARKATELAASTAAAQQAQAAANLKTVQQGQIRGQMQTGIQGLMSGLQQQAQQQAATLNQPVEVVQAGPQFDISQPLDVGFFGGYAQRKATNTTQAPQGAVKIASGGYLDDLLDAIR